MDNLADGVRLQHTGGQTVDLADALNLKHNGVDGAIATTLGSGFTIPICVGYAL